MADTESGGQWVTVEQAMALLGRSDRTIRRAVRDGRLPSRREGARLFVDVSGHLPAGSSPVIGVTDPLVEVIRLQAEVAHLRTLVERLTGEVDYLRSALAGALRLQQAAIESPRRGWRWPWSRD